MFARVLAVLAVIVAPLAALAQPLADRVPADAIVYIGWQGVDRMPPEYQASHLKAVIDGSNVRELFEAFIPQLIERAAAQGPGGAAGGPARLISSIAGRLARYPSAIYLCGIDVNAPAGPRPRLGILCQAGAEGDALLGQIAPLVRDAAGNLPFPLKAFKFQDLVGIVVGYDQENQALAGPGGAAQPLGGLDRFQQALAAVHKKPVVIIYADAETALANVDQVLAKMGSPAQASWPRMRDGLGLAGLNRLIFTAGFDGPNWSTRGFIAAPAPRAGLLGMLSGAPLGDGFLNLVPQSANWVVAAQCNLRGVFDGIRALVANVGGPIQQFDQGVQQINAIVGMDFRNDVLGTFGSEWACFCDPASTGSGTLSLTIINRLAEPQTAEATFTRLEDLANQILAAQMKAAGPPMRFAFTRGKVGDMTIHTFGIPLIAPSWTVRNGVLYAGFYPQTVVGAAESGAAKGKSILDNVAFQALRKQLGGQNAASLSFVNLPATAPQDYTALLPMSQLLIGIGQMFGVDAPPLLVPSLNRLYPHLTPAAAFAWADDAGLHFRSQSPFPGSEILGTESNMSVGAAALGVSIMLPALNAAKERANRVKCASNLRQIGMGCILYANDHKGTFPPDPATLVTEQNLNPQVFLCPSAGHDLPAGIQAATPADKARWVTENSDYIYLGANMKLTGGPRPIPVFQRILAYEKPEGHGNEGINILFADAHVEWVTQPAATEMIQKQTGK